jgi:hypothetical protein
MSSNVQVSGAKSTEEMKSEAQRETEVQESAKVMDFVKPLPVEVTPPDRDLKNSESQTSKIEKAEDANTESQSSIREAEPPKAKVRQKRVRKNLEPTPPAGTPSPDYLKEMQSRFDKIEAMHRQTHDLFGAMQKFYASQTPLQQNGVVPRPQKIQRKEAPNYTNNYEDMDQAEDVPEIPLHSSYNGKARQQPIYRKEQPIIDDHEVNLYNRRNKQAMEHMMYDTPTTNINRQKSSETQRGTASWHSSGW